MFIISWFNSANFNCVVLKHNTDGHVFFFSRHLILANVQLLWTESISAFNKDSAQGL